MKKKKLKIKPTTIIIIILLLIIIIILMGNSGNVDALLLKALEFNQSLVNKDNIDIYGTSNKTPSSNNIDEISSSNIYTQAEVVRIVDGDTIVVKLNNQDYKVRFIGMDTPENTTEVEYYGKEATEYTTKILEGKTVYLEKDVSQTDKYGRLLRYVWLEIPTSITDSEIRNKMLNAKLIIDGYANISTYTPDVKYVDYFKTYEAEARDNKNGLWGK